MTQSERFYLDPESISSKKIVRRWIEVNDLHQGECQLCKQTTQVCRYYSIMDEKLLNLCEVDILKVDNFITNSRKDGRIYTVSPFDTISRPKKKRRWSIPRYRCDSCREISSFYGYSRPDGERSFYFVGNCEYCGFELTGDTYKLLEESRAIYLFSRRRIRNGDSKNSKEDLENKPRNPAEELLALFQKPRPRKRSK